MLEEVISFITICIMRRHVLRADMSSVGQVLQEDMSCGKLCIMGGHVL